MINYILRMIEQSEVCTIPEVEIETCPWERRNHQAGTNRSDYFVL